MDRFVSLLVSGLAFGMLVSMVALGFMVIYKATGVINFAQGDMVTAGAYLTFWSVADLHLPLGLAYLLGVAAMTLLGVALERLAYAPLRSRSTEAVVISTLGIAVIIRTVVTIWKGSDAKSIPSPFGFRSVTIFGAVVSDQRLLIIGVTAVLLVVTWLLFQRSSFGRQLRAAADDRSTASLYGVPVNGLAMAAFGLSGALAGLAAILYGPVAPFDSTLGFDPMLSAFAAAILGGFGNIGGMIVGAQIIALTQTLLGGYVLSEYSTVLPFVVLIVILAIRPTGLFRSARGARL